MERSYRLIEYYLPPDGYALESLVATTYQVDFEFLEEELLAAALGVRSPVSRVKAFRSELERRLQKAEVSVLFDLGGCDRLARLSPRIDAIPIAGRKLHSKISLLMWVREDRDGPAPSDRRISLIVGSANLTQQGFRYNYECVAAVQYGGRTASPRTLLTTAISLVKQIAAESQSPQLLRQLAAFEEQAAHLPIGADDSVAMVDAIGVVPRIRDSWAATSSKPPESVTVVSPFWTEGSTAPEALSNLFQQLGSPSRIEMVCRGEQSPDGKSWLPVFDKGLAVGLKNLLGSSRLFLRAALPDAGLQDSSPTASDVGDELEERELATHLRATNPSAVDVQRLLHAKVILVDGAEGSVLYSGSSNCTRRGLGLASPSNFEAGLVYRLTPRQRKQMSDLLTFAGPPTEVHSGTAPATVQPLPEEEKFVPNFLSEIVASGALVAVSFRAAIPADLVILMPVPAMMGDSGYWLLFQAEEHSQRPAPDFAVDLVTCPRCDEHLHPLAANPSGQVVQAHVSVEVRWQGHSATFPVRFDDKSRLPLLLAGRKPSEGELIDYFLFGREPGDWEDDRDLPWCNATKNAVSDSPIDTTRILAYFIRRFVQALPGIEAEIRRAGYSRASLDAALRGPTSPLALAERAYASMTTAPRDGEPEKTPTAVGFQLTEILAALLRTRSLVADAELQLCFHPVIASCRQMLADLVSNHVELQTEAFQLYQGKILEAVK